MHLTENEKSVIRFLLIDARIKDSEISRRLGISLQAVRKIRKKLESRGLITGYIPTIDYSKLGINVFVIALLKIRAEQKLKLHDIKEKVCSRNVLKIYKVHGDDITHIIHLGFRSIDDFRKLRGRVQSAHGKNIEIKGLYIISGIDIIHDSPNGLIELALSEDS